MNISRGLYRGIKLKSLSSDNTRPTTQKVKEALFNMIASYVREAEVLDLFAGSGSLGIECLSMKAKWVDFNDANYQAKKIILSNLTRLKNDNYQVYNSDYIKLINYLKNNERSYDIIFLDPPYDYHIINELITMLIDNNLIKENGIIVGELSQEEVVFDNYQDYYKYKDKSYGSTRIVVYKKEII
jgi:16S rRNA (guanine(966)-N(2))-methyltransferase RsmD